MRITKVQIHNLAAQINLTFSDIKFKAGKHTYKYSVKDVNNNLIAYGDTLAPIYEILIKMGASEPVKIQKAPKVKKEKAVKTDSTTSKTTKNEWSFTESKAIAKRFGMSLVIDSYNFKCNVLDSKNQVVHSDFSASSCASWLIQYAA